MKLELEISEEFFDAVDFDFTRALAVSRSEVGRARQSSNRRDWRLPMANHYDGFHGRVYILQEANWYSVTDLMRALRQVRCINWTVKESRQQAPTVINGIDTTCPYARDRRFPGEGYFVCEVLGDWARKFQQLRGSLSFADHAKDGKSRDMPASVFTDANDAQSSFQNSTTAMMHQIVRMHDVFDQRTFEAVMRVQWV